jgi:hypothetical protein
MNSTDVFLAQLAGQPDLRGTVLLFGCAFELELIAVRFRDGHLQEPIFDPRRRFAALCTFDERGPFQPVQVPGRRGSFIALAVRPASGTHPPDCPELVPEDVHPLPDEANHLGRVRLFGVDHHLDLIEVHTRNRVLTARLDPHDRLGTLLNLARGAQVRTVRVPGIPGVFVPSVTPYCLT